MRRHLNLSLESLHHNSGPILSLEEEQIVMSDAADLAGEINQELNECDRIVEVSNALEDLAVIADQIEQASPVEIALIEKAGDMAVAGTDIDANEVIPSMESFQGKRIATESIRQTAATIWTNILEFVNKVYEKIEKFFYNIFGTIPTIRKRLTELSEKIVEAGKKSTSGTVIELGAGTKHSSILNRLAVGDKVPSNDGEFKNELTKILDFSKFIYGENITHRNNLGKEIAKCISEFNPVDDLDAQADKIIAACDKFNHQQRFPGGVKNSSKSGNFENHSSEILMGGGKFLDSVFVSKEVIISKLAQMDHLRNSKMTFTQDSVNLDVAKIKLPILSTSAMDNIVKSLNDILDSLENYERGPEQKMVVATRKELENAAKQAEKRMVDEEANIKGNAIDYFRSFINFNQAYVRWISDAPVPFARYLVNEVNAVVAFLNMCLSTYK